MALAVFMQYRLVTDRQTDKATVYTALVKCRTGKNCMQTMHAVMF